MDGKRTTQKQNDKKVDLQSQKSQQELLLEKIEHLLAATDPDDWRKGGTPLNPNDRFKKPRYTWEEIYTLPIPAGVLAIRKSTPVKSDFLGRGFMLMPQGAPCFTVELRPHGWHHSELTDPYKRTQNSDTSFRVLCEGEIAVKIYRQIEKSYDEYHNAQQRDFDKEAYDFASRLPALLREETTSLWERIEETPGDVHFITEMNDMRIEVVHNFIAKRENYALSINKLRLRSNIDDRVLAKEVFEAVEQLGMTSRLHTLSQALEEL